MTNIFLVIDKLLKVLANNTNRMCVQENSLIIDINFCGLSSSIKEVHPSWRLTLCCLCMCDCLVHSYWCSEISLIIDLFLARVIMEVDPSCMGMLSMHVCP